MSASRVKSKTTGGTLRQDAKGATNLIKDLVVDSDHVKVGLAKSTRSTKRSQRTSFVRRLLNSENVRVFDDCIPQSAVDPHALNVAKKMVSYDDELLS